MHIQLFNLRIQKKLREYFPVGLDNKKNRDNWLKEKLAQLPAHSRILDAGAGELKNKPLCSHLIYLSQDFCQFKGGNLDAPGLGNEKIWNTDHIDIVCDITKIPEPDESFDAILCSEVFEHLPNPIAALQELSRILKPGGKLILTAPFNSLTHQSPYFFYTGFSRFFYEHWCHELSLEILELSQNGNYFDYIAQELRRITSFGKKYANLGTSPFQNISIQLILSILQNYSNNNDKSEETLCFGYHLLAEKIDRK